MAYSSIKDTLEHKRMVSHYLNIIITELINRSEDHDISKMQQGEVESFDEFTPKLKDSTYGSDQYNQFLKDLKPALDHHYGVSRHHPEHFPNGIKDMDLVDIIEMICDWKASSMRHQDGNILKSIDINQDRFEYTKELHSILTNTVKNMFEMR